MNPTNLIKDLHTKIDGYECTFDHKDDEFLASLGLKKLTGLRDTCEKHTPETELDRLKYEAGHIGCNESAMQDFVCEKDGLQLGVFIYGGQWFMGIDTCYNNKLITTTS